MKKRPCLGTTYPRVFTATSYGRTTSTPWVNSGLEDCRWTPCYDCGACTDFGVEHVVAANVPPAGGSQGTWQDLSEGGVVPVRLLPTRPRPGLERGGPRHRGRPVASSRGAR